MGGCEPSCQSARETFSAASSRSTSRPGQPVGSKTLVERAGLGVSPSTVRYELAELERLGLLTHPHTSAGRVPTEAGYRLYVDHLLSTPEPRPAAFTLDLPGRARRGRGGAADDDRDALAGDPAARGRLGAGARVGQRPPRRGAAAAAERRHGRRDHVDRRRHEAPLLVRRAGRPGSRQLGVRVPERAPRRRAASARARRSSRSTSRRSAAASARSCSSCARRSSRRPTRSASCSSAAPPACSTRCAPRRSAPTAA